MDKMTCNASQVKYASAAEWPDWCDDYRWSPTEADDAENAAQNNGWDDDGPAPDDPIWDEWANEAEAASQLEAGLRMF